MICAVINFIFNSVGFGLPLKLNVSVNKVKLLRYYCDYGMIGILLNWLVDFIIENPMHVNRIDILVLKSTKQFY